MTRKHSHCSYCGGAFGEGQPWPRTCAGCGEISYLNPLPVAVLLLPVDGGLLCVRRSIPPRAGWLALPGGFIDVNETWQEAAARELREEAGVVIDPGEVLLFDVLSPDRGEPFLLVFGIAAARASNDLPPYQPTNETSERLVLAGPQELAFPLHTQAAREYFARRASGP
jgi:ADP-ribose pyrophosphatase YjhB (NUDIX family)